MNFPWLHDGADRLGPVLPRSSPLALRSLGERGPVVVLLHGIGRSGSMWWPVMVPLSTACRVYALDNPGIASSQALRVPDTIEGHAALYAQTLANAGIAEPVHLVGLSLGGMVACALASQLGGGCASLSILASSSRETGFWRLSPSGVMRTLARYIVTGSRHRATIPGLVSADLLARYPDLSHNVAVHEGRQGRRRFAMTRQLMAAAKFRLAPHLPGLPPRRQVIVGTGDQLVPPRNSRRLAELTASPLHEVERRGHDLALDGGERLIALILALVTGSAEA